MRKTKLNPDLVKNSWYNNFDYNFFQFLRGWCLAKCFQTNMMHVKKFGDFWRDIFYTCWFFLVKIPNLPHIYWADNTLENLFLIIGYRHKVFPWQYHLAQTILNKVMMFEVWCLKFASGFKFKICYKEFASFGQLH